METSTVVFSKILYAFRLKIAAASLSLIVRDSVNETADKRRWTQMRDKK